MTYFTELGQLVDLLAAPENDVDLNRFSLLKHRFIVVYKTSYYSFYLPVALAMIYAGIPVPKEMPGIAETLRFDTVDYPTQVKQGESPYHVAMDILLPLGEYFQVQDDYLDCFGVDIGKIGTDIMDNKCSWVVCTALKVLLALFSFFSLRGALTLFFSLLRLNSSPSFMPTTVANRPNRKQNVKRSLKN